MPSMTCAIFVGCSEVPKGGAAGGADCCGGRVSASRMAYRPVNRAIYAGRGVDGAPSINARSV
jgi:hypothetical protein